MNEVNNENIWWEKFNESLKKEYEQIKFFFGIYLAASVFIVFQNALSANLIFYMDINDLGEKSIYVLICLFYLIIISFALFAIFNIFFKVINCIFCLNKDEKKLNVIFSILAFLIAFGLVLRPSFFNIIATNIKNESIGKNIISCEYISDEKEKKHCELYKKKIESHKNIKIVYYTSNRSIWDYTTPNGEKKRLIIPNKYLERNEQSDD